MKLSPAKLKKKLYFVAAGYFRFWAKGSFKRWHPRVIAVTGSVGKTTMLQLLKVQLGDEAHYSDNANSAFGIAFDQVGLRGITGSKWRWLYLLIAVPVKSLCFHHKETFYVAEIDGERPHEAQFLADWLQPEVTLWVSLGRSHAVFFDSQVQAGQFATVEEAIAHEFGSLPRATQKLVVIDGTNRVMQQQVSSIHAAVQAVQPTELTKYQVWPNRSQFTVDRGTFRFHYPMPRETYVQLAMLKKLAIYLGQSVHYDMSAFEAAPSRSSYFKGKKGINIIDSSYNAHLISMESILHMMQAMRADHKWLVIGDMVDQGKGEADQHQKLGKALTAVTAERYILVGRRTKKYTAPVLQQAGKASLTVCFSSVKEALNYLNKELTGKETVLFKGSQYLEWLVEKLLADSSQVKLLARQEPAARARRASWGLY